ncbi:MAG TPA: hypothetical protein VJA94_01565 [Candidatus Angelobacter sp.]
MRRLSGLFLVVLASMLAMAQRRDCATMMQQALDLTGVNQDIDAMAQMVVSDDYLREITASKDDGSDFAAIFKPVMRKNFDGPSLKKELLHRVVARCQPERMEQALQELQSPFVAHMLELETSRYTPERQEKIKQYMRIIEIAPPPDSQLSAAEAFDEKVGESEFTVEYLFAIYRGILTGAGAPPDVIKQLQEHRKQMKARIEGLVQASILITYTGVSKADLAKYGQERSSGSLKWYYDTVRQSFLEMLELRARAIGQDVRTATVAQTN